ncbi:hypothetical protein CJ030_MR5G011866 [Morella rubra]|uniref:SAM domain-containing protein n=1 Tax=Morella rubra TaxID=262757 RepID=A0A6A1VLM3_9ROSI|nr:hypothetical protein CJ030_MR5G011866 [Morella rubra]
MVVLSFSSKRQRRPNVRLEEIGDVSAAFACGFLQKTKGKVVHKRWKHDFVSAEEIEERPMCGFSKQSSPRFKASEPGFSPRISADLQHNRENKNPNSTKIASELPSSEVFDSTKCGLDFGNITQKCRVMKRRGRSTMTNPSVFGCTWSSKLTPEFSSEDARYCGGKEFTGFSSEDARDFGGREFTGFLRNDCTNYYPENGCQDFSDHKTPATSKEASEYDMCEPPQDVGQPGKLTGSWRENACYEGNNAFTSSAGVWDEMRSEGNGVNSVKKWLQELGFGNYAGVFKMHEIDERALPLLTLDDLKEIGVLAVGPRRKLYAAIQQLRAEDVFT